MHTNVVSFPLPSVCFLATIERRVVIAWDFLLKTIVGRCCLVRAADGHGHPRATCHAHCAMGLAEADTKMVVATGHGDCQKLKDLVQEQDPTTMLVVMASGKQTSPKKDFRCEHASAGSSSGM